MFGSFIISSVNSKYWYGEMLLAARDTFESPSSCSCCRFCETASSSPVAETKPPACNLSDSASESSDSGALSCFSSLPNSASTWMAATQESHLEEEPLRDQEGHWSDLHLLHQQSLHLLDFLQWDLCRTCVSPAAAKASCFLFSSSLWRSRMAITLQI